MNVIQLMMGDDCGSKAHERKTWLCPFEYLGQVSERSDQTCRHRELGKAGREQELKPGKDVRKAERDLNAGVKAATITITQGFLNTLAYMKKTHTLSHKILRLSTSCSLLVISPCKD